MAIPPAGTPGVRRRDLRGLTVRRRQRVASDRLHVTNEDGAELGWYDLLDQQVHAASPGVVPALLAEIEHWLKTWGDDRAGARPGGDADVTPELDSADPGPVRGEAVDNGVVAVPRPDLPPPDPRSRVRVRRLYRLPEPYAPAPAPGAGTVPLVPSGPSPALDEPMAPHAQRLIARAFAGDAPPPPAVLLPTPSSQPAALPVPVPATASAPPTSRRGRPPAPRSATPAARRSAAASESPPSTRTTERRCPAVVEPYDLVGRRPGAMAWEQAEALRAQAPVRTFLGRLTDAHTEERSWRVGAKGEEAVADQLARLRGRDPRWGYLNAVPVGTRGSDIDHVVMGPGGVFTINAKHHPDGKVWVAGSTLMVNGKKWPYLRNAVHEADRASRLLSEACDFHVSVFPMIVLVGHASLTIRTPPEGVLLLNRRQLSKFLRRLPDVVPPAELSMILDQARISTTWSSR